MRTERITPAGMTVRALDMHGLPVEPFVPFAVRGPQFLELKDGTLLYSVETKLRSQADEEPGPRLLLRSRDGGKTWGEARAFLYEGAPLGGIRCGISLVYDEVHDTVICFARTRHWKPGMEQPRVPAEPDQIQGLIDERFWISRSRDGGLTWSDYREIALGIPDGWVIGHCPTPGTGIQLKHQKDPARNGRLIVPANHSGRSLNGRNELGAHLLVSDDFGETWKLGAVQRYPGGNECLAAELSDGTLILNARSLGSDPPNVRLQSVSLDGGDSFVSDRPVLTLYDPCCHGGFCSASAGGRDLLFFCAPTGPLGEPWVLVNVLARWGRREALMLYGSADRGETYRPIRQLSPKGEFAAYSALCATRGGTLLCAWESGPQDNQYRDVRYLRLDIADLARELEG